MQALLSFDQAPPISAPLRFFLTAPLFGLLAGGLILYSGPLAFASRWTPSTLALTHLITVGFMLQVMLGALLQLLPVVVGANMTRPLLTARLVHLLLSLGALALAAAFISFAPLLFGTAVACLGAGITLFIASAGRALRGIGASSPTVRGLKAALLGLAATVLSGAVLALALGWSVPLPLLELTDLHLGWGLMAWACTVLAAVSFVVVPMFQLTPEYPLWFARRFAFAVLALLGLWTLAELWGAVMPARLLGAATLAAGAAFAALTLRLLGASKRPQHDASHRLWRWSMTSALLASALWLASRFIPALALWAGLPLLLGVLLLLGCFTSAIVGMLYKIVPFLVWLHLQNHGRGRVLAPNMRKVLPQSRVDAQVLAHFTCCALATLAVFWPAWFAHAAGLALVVANAWLLRNLLYATGVYRKHLLALEADPSKPPSAPGARPESGVGSGKSPD